MFRLVVSFFSQSICQTQHNSHYWGSIVDRSQLRLNIVKTHRKTDSRAVTESLRRVNKRNHSHVPSELLLDALLPMFPSQCPPRYFPLSVRLHWTQLLPCLTCFPCLHVAPQVSESSGCRERHTEDGRRASVYVREIWSGERAAAGGGLTKITTSSY